MKRRKRTPGSLCPPIPMPKAGYLPVLGIARISGKNQDELSLKDQEKLYRSWLKRNFDGPFRLKMIATRASGERLDRKELIQARRAVRSGKFKLVIAEDLGRIARRVAAYTFAEDCEDCGVRLIAINDHLDTAKPDWRNIALFAAYRHETYNADTAARIRRSQQSRFMEGRILPPHLLFCYSKPRGAKHDSRVKKVDKYIWVVEGIWQRLEDGWSYWEVADWLNENKIPTGPGCKTRTWTGQLVKGFVFNPILKGLRRRNYMKSRRNNKTGRHTSVRAHKKERLFRKCPHLAFIESDRYNALIAKLTEINAKYTKNRSQNGTPRENRRSRWPSAHAICGICGRAFVNGGHGVASHLMCNGARQYRCWNSTTFDRDFAIRRIPQVVLEAIMKLPEFDETFLSEIRAGFVELSHGQTTRRTEIDERLAEISREMSNLVTSLKKYGDTDEISESIEALRDERLKLTMERDELPEEPRPAEIPSMTELRKMASEAMSSAAANSKEFSRVIRRIIPVIKVFPVRSVEGGQPVMRATFRVRLSRLSKATRALPALDELLPQVFEVDLFDPPQQVAHRERIMSLRTPKSEGGEGLTEAAAAKRVGITKTAAQRAAALDRLMRSKGVDDPYIRLTAPPEDFRKMRRHLHKRYIFEPLAVIPEVSPDVELRFENQCLAARIGLARHLRFLTPHNVVWATCSFFTF